MYTIAALRNKISTLEEKFHICTLQKPPSTFLRKMRFYHSPLGLFLAACCLAFTQALCKLSELDSSELNKEYKDPTDAYVIGDIIQGT